MVKVLLKKAVLFLLCLVLLASLLPGCQKAGTVTKGSTAVGVASTQEATQPEPTPNTSNQYGDTGGLKLPLVDKVTTISYMLGSDVLDLNQKPIFAELEKRTNIKVDIQAVAYEGFPDKVKVTLASGKIPDIIEAVPTADTKSLGAQGALVAINQYADMLPNFKKLYMEEEKWVMKTFSDDKGDLYIWPVYGINRAVNHGFLYRKDIFDKNGIKEWTNTEEFYQALKTLKEKYPDSTPYASKTKELIFSNWAYGWGIGSHQWPCYYDENVKEWKLATTTPEYKDMIDFMKKLYNEGLLDPEFLTDTPAAWTAKMTTDKSFVTWDWIGRLDMFYSQVKDQNPDYNLRYANPIGPVGKIQSLSKVDNFGIVVANNPNKEAALKLLDYLTSPSGATLITMGIEGVHFTIDPATNKPVYPELKDMEKIDINTLTEKFGCWLEGMYLKPDKRSVYYIYTEKEQEAQDKMINGDKLQAYDPLLKYSDEETAKIGEIGVNVAKAGDEFTSKYITDKSYGEAEWKAWLEKAKKLDAQKYVDAHNAAQKRYDAN